MKALISRLEAAAARPELMAEMMDRLGLDAQALIEDGRALDLALAARRCAGCTAEEPCKSFLAATEHAEHAPGFCANASFFETVREG